ncbi:MAG: ACT domain-containing protein, partial [Sphingomonadales bacterium]
DFAFAVHSQVGLHTIGAKVNNKLVPINHVLKNGDIVEILTTQKPRANAGWLDLVKTGKARSKIREYLKMEKTKLAGMGKEMVERKFKSQGEVISEKNIALLMRHFQTTTAAEFYHKVANGDIKVEKLVLKDIAVNKSVSKPKTEKPTSPKKTQKVKGQIVIGDDFEMSYQLAKCCNPLPGDPIFGFITVGEGVKIHRTSCPNAQRLMSQYGYRIIAASWRSDGYEKPFEAILSVRGIDDVGIVSKITDIISKDMEVNMRSINIQANEAEGTFEGRLEVFLHSKAHLDLLMQKIQGTHQYIQVKRLDA